MRRELEILAQIDDFLEGRISKEELAKELEDVQNLGEHIQTQKALKVAMKKDAFMQQSKNSLSKFKLIKTVKTALVVITVLAAVIGVFFNQNQNADLTNSNTVKEKELIIAISDSLIKTQYFEINNLKDTLIVTNEGIVFFIPKNGFITGSSPIYQLEINKNKAHKIKYHSSFSDFTTNKTNKEFLKSSEAQNRIKEIGLKKI